LEIPTVQFFGIFGRYSVFSGICNTDVGIDIGTWKNAISVRYRYYRPRPTPVY